MSVSVSRAKASRSVAVKAKLDYPVIDTDLHTIEYTPLLEDYIHKYGGNKLVDDFRKAVEKGISYLGREWYTQTPEQQRSKRTIRSPWWGLPAKNTLDLATVTLPKLLHERLAEQGTDFAILYPNISLFPLHSNREDLRRGLTRAINHYHADLYRPYSDRLTPVAAIPLHTPQEGVEELEFAINELGLKATIIPGAIRRPIKEVAAKYPPQHHPDVARYAQWIDLYGLDSEHDYDPFWAKAVELGAALTTHSGSQGWTGRSSISNYMFNHINHFADASEALAKALFFGGVTRRFPKLRVGFLEAGAAWGAGVYSHLIDRYHKRSRDAVQNYNPDLVNGELLERLYEDYGADVTRGRKHSREELVEKAFGVSIGRLGRELSANEIDDFALAGIEKVEDIRDRFVPNFFFGTESDDQTVVTAFNAELNPLGVKLNAFWSSDSGHWDVPDLTETLAESWQLVERGLLSEQDFKAFVFGNPYKFYSEANPRFFEGTAVEARLNADGGVKAAE
jgi:predicted TIM-barrel fold metal-dependent hydrolase